MTSQVTHPSHVAILVPSVDHAADVLRNFGFNIGPAEIWDGEGTKEIYVEGEKGNSLLLMEPVKPGAYRRALDKRGPGLHHLAIDVLNIEEFLLGISSSGWLLHPMSIRTLKASKTAYLARPGFPALIEVQERESIKDRPFFVTEIALKLSYDLERLPVAIGLYDIVRATNEQPSIVCGEKRILLESLWNAGGSTTSETRKADGTGTWCGMVVEESLNDATVVNDFAVSKVKITAPGKWHIYRIAASDEQIVLLQATLKAGWYMHFWKRTDLRIVFADAIFQARLDDKSTWNKAISHGLKLGIPEAQLDFLTE